MSKELNSIKCNNIDITNDLSTSGVLNFAEGYVFLGNTYNGGTNDREKEYLPSKSYMGTSETRCNISRDKYNINTNGPILYNQTEDDTKQAIENNKYIAIQNPILTKEPWLYPLSMSENWTADTQTALQFSNNLLPIYKCIGKGLGDVEMYRTGESIAGNESSAPTIISTNPTNNLSYGNHQSTFRNGPLWPYDGTIYSGNLVQLHTETDLITGIKRTVVIPYQNGRGIMSYSDNYQPSTLTKLTDYGPWGQLIWPDSNNGISPCLSPGCEPGDNTMCVGMVLDSYSTTIPDERMFISKEPTFNQPTGDLHEKWYNHPAPHTDPPVSTKNGETQGFFSPGPNSSGGYWSPWPKYYAYKAGDPIPVLTKGITTGRIGAAVNISNITYGIKNKISATDETWLPVQCIPLFQGERIEAGSYVYASVKGVEYTPGPIFNFPNFFSGAFGQTLWDPFIDSTWGNVGWAGVPGLSFDNIPDNGVSIPETLKDQYDISKTIPYLNQANQGSIIVQAVTSVAPEPALGNAYLQYFLDIQRSGYTPAEIYNIHQERFNLPGISGRCTLTQTVPDKAQPIGIVLETIIGTGKWPYTGIPNAVIDNNLVGSLGGADYIDQTTPTAVSTRVAAPSLATGLTVEWTDFNPLYPYLGTIITNPPTVVVAGAGYVDGDIIIAKDDTIKYNDNIQYKGNNAAFSYDVTGGTLSFHQGGSGYDATDNDNTIRETQNLSRNNLYIMFTADGSGPIARDGTTPVIPSTTHFQDYTLFPAGTVFQVLDKSVPENERATYVVDVANDTTTTVTSYFDGSSYPTQGVDPVVYEINVINYNYANPQIDLGVYGTETNGTVLRFKIGDYGAGNLAGDIILSTKNFSDQDLTFEFPGLPSGYQEITPSVERYSDTVAFQTYITTDTTTPSLLSVDKIYIDPLREAYNGEKLAIGFNISDISMTTSGEIYQAFYTGGYNVVPSPWYHCRRFSILIQETDITTSTTLKEAKVMRGGSNYTSAPKVKCYNMSANCMRLRYQVTNGIITSKVINDPPNSFYEFDMSRYTFDATNGTEFRLLDNNVPEQFQQIEKLISDGGGTDIQTSTVTKGGVYSDLADGEWFFQTQRTDQTNPTVDIVNINDFSATFGTPLTKGQVGVVIMSDLGSGNQNGDIILVTQEGSDMNCFFIFNDSMPTIDLPPFAYREGYTVDSSEEAWNKYSNVMATATNLMDKQILFELRPSCSSDMETVYPVAQGTALIMPGTKDLYTRYY